MRWSMRFQMCVCVVLTAVAMDVWAARSPIRVDAGGWSTGAIGTAACPGTTAGVTAADTLVRRLGHVFSGHAHVEHLTNTYCQVAFDDAGTDPRAVATATFGAPVTSIISYSFLDDAAAIDAIGFQWQFTEFANGTTIVELRNVRLFSSPPETEVLDATSYIEPDGGGAQAWSGAGDNYDGEYFCFRNNAFIGTWDGQGLFPDSPCAAPTGGPIPHTVPTMGVAARGLLVLMLALLAVVVLRRR